MDSQSIYDLACCLGAFLKKKNLRLVTAESCTGGLLAATITDVPGSSEYFERGFITYSNAAKSEMLGVSTVILEEFGAVSENAASAMANGALMRSNADLSVAVTGVAGPGGGTPLKPVGMVCFAFAKRDFAGKSFTKYFSGDRISIRQQAVKCALTELKEIFYG